MRSILLFSTFFIFIITQIGAQKPKPPPKPLNVMCNADSLMIYQDCRICVCPKPSRPAKCFKKSCDLRTKDTGQCPNSVLRMDENKLCNSPPVPNCNTDNDCPEAQICCFDFCKGPTCTLPLPLDPGLTVHKGRGYP